jgi:integrase
MIQRRPNGRYAVTVYDPALRRRRQVGTYDKLKDARTAEADARLRVKDTGRETVASFHARWTRDFPRPKQSTNAHNTERAGEFARLHAHTPMGDITPMVVDRYLSADPKRLKRVSALRAMWNDARRRGVVTDNPWANLGISKGRGNRDTPPPSQDQIAVMLEHAWRLTPPSFACWLTFGVHTGMRPGELDALRRDWISLDRDEIEVREQWSSASRAFTRPKNGKARTIALTPPARDALLRLPTESDFAFTTLRGTHYTPSSRSFHWNRVRAAAGLDDKTLYVCTRHYAGWYMLNVLDMDAPVVAHQLGHEDGGREVERTYGHRDRARSLEKIKRAWAAEVRPLRAVDERDAG